MKVAIIPQYNNNYNYKYNARYFGRNNSNVVFGADFFNKKALKVAQERVKHLEAKNASLETHNKVLEELLKKLQIPGLVGTKDVIEKLLDDLKKQFSKDNEEFFGLDKYKSYIAEKLAEPLSYDPMVPVFNRIEDRKPLSFAKVFKYKEAPEPTSVKKATSTISLVNKLFKDGFISFDYTNETSKIIKNSKAYIKGKEFGLNENLPTDMTKKYGKRVGWSDEKIARDLLQNFYDAHGHSLEGTKIEITTVGKKYKVRISGLSEYEHENIQYIGAGDKDNDLYNAGGFGEGTKILSAVLLANEKTEKVTFSSVNWSIDYRLNNNTDNAIIMRQLNKLEEPTKGNFVEFETTDLNLVRKIIEARNYFYHPENPDFKDLTFENEHWGFKILPKDEGGNLYMTQRFEYETNGSWEDPLDEIVLIFKRRPQDAKLLGKNRDRINLKSSELVEIIEKDFANTMTDEELANAILNFEPMWNLKNNRKIDESMAYKVFKALVKVASGRFINFDFENKKYASLHFSLNPEIWDIVKNLGYELVNTEMYYMGVDSVNNIYKKTRKHIPIKPNETEKKKLILLEEGIALLAEDKKMAERINLEEARKPRFIFDAKEAKEENTIAESVNENKVYKGHWVDRKALNNKDFYYLLATWLHEITHKYGGDGTNEFGYKLTDVMGLELESLMNEPERLEKLRYLRSVFNKL
ncbi:MAG: hypothetical protein E7Z92_00300 [Cyanobacteria bacterium SIG31]|nr:hypothetical protein [Cyanobacteria bacterium SIG31]